MFENLFVRKTQDAEAPAFQMRLADSVFLGLSGMDRSINLDDELEIGAVEIDDEAVEHELSPEFQP